MRISNQKRVLFLGVGGISMFQLALAYKSLGYIVFGYDAKISKFTKLLQEKGIIVSNRFNKKFLNVDFCVKTGAIKEDNKFVITLKAQRTPILDRAEVLGELCKSFKCVIAVAGTHGKSTTASLIYEILRSQFKRVSCHIGAEVFAPRFCLGDDFLVVEACEYNKSFLQIFPNISVVTNVEAEHMDSYGSLFKLKNAFLTFLKRGERRFATFEQSTKFLSKAQNVQFVKTKQLSNTKLKGEYNQKNISLALKVCESLGVEMQKAEKIARNFAGVPRRYELIGKYMSTAVYIDYAHHPTEIKSFISTFILENANSLIVFQPHTFSRTQTFFKEFIEVFKDIKNLIIFKEYPAREKQYAGKSAHELYLAIKEFNPNVHYSTSAKKIVQHLQNFKAVAFVGAGDINEIALKLVKTL